MRLFFLFFLLFLLIIKHGCLYFPNGTQYGVPTATVNGEWQQCGAYSSAAFSTFSLADLLILCPGDYIMFTCNNPLDPSLFGAAAWGLKSEVLSRTPFAAPSGSNGTLWYQSNSTLQADSNSTTNCSSLSGDQFCLNLAPAGSSYMFQPGVYCGAIGGYQQQMLVNIGIYSVPCYNLAYGTPCSQPGVINCGANATCQGNITCAGAQLNPTPPLDLTSCVGPVACDLISGNFSNANRSIGAPCTLNDGCFTNDICNGYGTCEHSTFPISPCAPTNNSCLNQPTCESGGGPTYNCTYAPFPNGTVCAYDNNTLCRTGDACMGGICIEGAAQLGPTPDPCMFNATCDPFTGLFIVTGLPDNSSCVPANPCTINGRCLNFRCSISDPKPPPDPPSVCQVASACNISTGIWDFVPNNSGNPCIVNNCTSGTCFFGNCTALVNKTCFGNSSNPCSQGACDPLVPGGCIFTNVADGTPCNENQCLLGGTCSSGFCAGGTPATCPISSLFDASCIAPSCDPALGCLLNPYPAGTHCNKTCIFTGLGLCTIVGTCVGPTIPHCVNGTILSSAGRLELFVTKIFNILI